MVVVVVVIRGKAEEAKAESLIRAFFYDVDDFVPCEQTHFWPTKTSSSLPLWKYLQGSAPSFLPSLETPTKFRSFLPFQGVALRGL
jgi:hypothetical protein